jgi:Spy/CpxP family protein refolding chaperone
MKNSRLRPLGALALSLSLCGGFISMSHTVTAAPSKKPPQKGGNPLDAILGKLKLTSDQKATIKVILDAANVEIKAVQNDTSLNRDAKEAAIKVIVDQAYADISDLLTAEQKTTFAAWVAAEAKKPTGPKPTDGKPTGGKPPEDKPTGGKPTSGKPTGGKPGGGDCDKPTGDKPTPTKTPTATPVPTAVPTATPDPDGGSGDTA